MVPSRRCSAIRFSIKSFGGSFAVPGSLRCAIDQTVGKLSDPGTAKLPPNDLILKRIALHRLEGTIHREDKVDSQARPFSIIPVSGFGDLGFRFGSNDQLAAHLSRSNSLALTSSHFNALLGSRRCSAYRLSSSSFSSSLSGGKSCWAMLSHRSCTKSMRSAGVSFISSDHSSARPMEISPGILLTLART